MTTTLPRSIIASKRSGFSLIDPQTELFHHKVGRAQHVAISYVWSDWTDDPDAGHHLRHWPELRQRLLTVVGPGASTFMKICSGHATRCWLDCKCIDQDSAADKSYWVPRMNEIYSEARCTVLLLRGVDIAPLQKAESLLGCDIDDDNHSCILTQSCASVTMTEELEESCLSSLRSIFAGAWRKRAWIFQEILLSKEYILNDGGGGEIKLSDLGTIASLLFRAHSDKEWLGELASWCRRIFRLRAYYFNYTLCPSNVLQLATSLDATLPCDKYYALCGVLRLKSVQYQITHTEHEALQNILVALTVEGRFSWLCAIPPSLPGHANRLVLDGPLLPYIENQLDLHATFYGQPEVSKSTVSFSCYHVGHVKETAPLAERIEEAAKFATDMSSPSATDIPRHIAIVPALLLRICRDAILPLVTEPILSRLCKVFHIPVKDAGSTVLMKLLTLRDPSSLYTAQQQQEQLPRGGNPLSGLDIDMAIAAARAIQHHLDDVKKDLDFVTWTAFPPDKDKTGNGTTEYYAIGTKGGTTTGTDTHVFSIRRRASHEFRLATLCLADGLAPTCTAILLRPFGARRQRRRKYRLTLQLEQAQCTGTGASGGGGGGGAE
ncbi:uncharacterized protein A1O5_03296 [Cladophialophora psammophila CBS 110553]|uniref:Heterokaryon incompatibility domain-containing protein n=1 Tax=Cladophialophora psammophila CBS 110553 TaxID=1182543 RepID=W9X882_9EURO|nr:uncharacterized protein A1O5_03296 [Cladophialophora psammophila CBS 110553]EXJ73535.1 hypothetical protein A1O5_03296 [Cladophialophora psammophila CBS 110553]